MKSLLLASLTLLITVSAQPQPTYNTTVASLLNIGKFLEGALYGLFHEQFPLDEQECMSDLTQIEQKVVNAVHDFQLETFEGMRMGLNEVGQALKLIPEAVKGCKVAIKDLEELVRMTAVFEHPVALIYVVGRNLWVNGADVYDKVEAGIAAYKKEDFFSFGQKIGEALDEVLYKQQAMNSNKVWTKRPTDVKAYSFLNGFFGGIEGVHVNEEVLYNKIDGKGVMIFGPVEAAMRTLLEKTAPKMYKRHFWMAIHEVQHVFLEGGEVLVSSSVLTREEVEKVRAYAECLDAQDSEDIFAVYQYGALNAYMNQDYYLLGAAFSGIAAKVCGFKTFLQE